MARDDAHTYPRTRLHVEAALGPGVEVRLDRDRTHFLTRVLRLGPGAAVALFNGRDGEWAARLAEAGKSACTLVAETLRRPQPALSGPWLLFAPVKRGPVDLLVQKATELGAARLLPVETARTAVDRVNTPRLRIIAAEAAEQSERLDVPDVAEAVPLDRLLAGWPVGRRLLVCDESGSGPPIARALAEAGAGDWAILAGPEGGLTPGELDALGKLPFVTKVHLGPRILRAETAAIAALAIWQAVLGDGADAPPRGAAPGRAADIADTQD